MPGTANKVKFNIRNCYYAPKTSEGEYGSPVPLPGAVSLSLEQQGELTPFWADGIKYYVSTSNGGYEGDLELAIVPDQFRKDILSEVEDTNKVLIENALAESKEFAFGCQMDGDKGPILFWFYNCTATRPSVTANTTEDTKEPTTDTISISCAAGTDGIVRAKTGDATDQPVINKWFESVYKKDQSIEDELSEKSKAKPSQKAHAQVAGPKGKVE